MPSTVRELLPSLEYPITRRFESTVGTASAYAVGFLSLVVLSVLNVALVGYEPITVFRSDFNATQHFWFNKFVPSFASRQPKSKCDAHVFNVGDSLITNSSIFEWKVDRVSHANAGDTGFSYQGETLENCDVAQVALYGDLRTWSIDTNVYVACAPPGLAFGEDDWYIIAVASFGLSGLPARQTSFQRLGKSVKQGGTLSNIADLLTLAGIDIASQVEMLYKSSGGAGTIAYSVEGDWKFCPPSWISRNMSSCAATTPRPPDVRFSAASEVLGNNTLLPPLTDPASNYTIPDLLQVPTENFMQLVRAAVLADLGSSVPNNILTDLNAIDMVIKPRFPDLAGALTIPSRFYEAWKSQKDPLGAIPGRFGVVTIPGPSTFQSVYICHFSKLKSAGSLVVSVMVATLSMFSSAWGLGLLLAARVAKRGGGSENYCYGHKASKGRKSSNESDDGEQGAFESGTVVSPFEKWDSTSFVPGAGVKPHNEPLLQRQSYQEVAR